MPRSSARCALLIYLALLALTGCSLAALLAWGWWPASPGDVAGLGATAERCQSAFGPSWSVVNGAGWDSAKNVLYVKGAWYIHVGFNEAGRAEQFIFCKAKLPLIPSSKMSAAEQQTLLDRFRDGRSWVPDPPTPSGPVWKRADRKAFALYVPERRWLIVMDLPCLARKVRSLPGNMELDPSTL